MPTHLLPLRGDDMDAVRSIAQSMYLDGECYAFAIAVSRGTGLPIVGLMEDALPRHALVYHRNKNTFVDVRGEHTMHSPELGRPFGHRPRYHLKEIPEEQLYSVRPIGERSIEYARKYADIILPGLPWKDSRTVRAKAFCDELEALCRRHGYWLRSQAPGMKPVLSEAHGDEAGYTIEPTATGMDFVIDRRLVGESLQ